MAVLARRRRHRAAITVDYETWQPIPDGKEIDWDIDIFEPAERLAALCETLSVPITFFVEMGEYLWLTENDPAVARRIETQVREFASRGHEM